MMHAPGADDAVESRTNPLPHERRSARNTALAFAAALAVSLLGGCAAWNEGPGYYLQSIVGHLSVMSKARPIATVVADPQTSPALRRRLEDVRAIRSFASDELGLPRNGSYTEYADLGRSFVVWNVFATPALSMRLEQWCFPFVGCVAYRGYFDREDAERFAQQLRDEGLDVVVRGVPAYSTLGWFDDPVLNTFIGYPEAELARLIFHELAHQELYVKGDTTFNESFATTVEREGVRRWLDAVERRTQDTKLRVEWKVFDARRQQFLALLKRHRAKLEALYASPVPDEAKRAGKREIFIELRRDYEALKRSWGGFAGYDGFFAQPLTNAHLASIASYTDLVPAFRALLEREAGDLTAFYAAARRIGRLPADERRAALDALEP
ncbi:MAG: aminopeptidase [Burkholderiaceae bacterium]|nr:aminopeptidase [Burkholderiaceae bacterium]